MTYEDQYPTQHTTSEQQIILRDLHNSLRNARMGGDEAREYYTQEAINALIRY